ncbi:MAG: Ig-like domain-containing protein [Candidatus Woesearchaeota archaeon]
MIRMSNNCIAALAVLFIIVSLLSNLIIYHEAEPRPAKPTGKSYEEAYLYVCINAPARLNVSCDANVTAYYNYTCIAKNDDLDMSLPTVSCSFPGCSVSTANSSFIVIATPDNSHVGNQSMDITANDNVGCINSIFNYTANFSVFFNYPPLITSYQPNESKLPEFPNFNLEENKSVRFNVSFFELLDEQVAVAWYVNHTLRNQTLNASSPDYYVFHTNFSSWGVYSVMLVLSDVFNLQSTINWTVNVTNVNRPPVFIANLPSQSWFKGQIKGAFYLNDYVYDPDQDDKLSFGVVYHNPLHSILASIHPYNGNYVVFTQPDSWVGTEQVFFTVQDNWGGFDASNNVTLSVVEPPTTYYPPQSTAGGGGGGRPKCIEEWFCEKWSLCAQNGTMARLCMDLNNCNTIIKKPNTTARCVYIRECYDGVQNQGEDGIDCGGPCPPCATCYDRLQNQGESGIDCGGPCDTCPGEEKPASEEKPAVIIEKDIVVQRLQEGLMGVWIVASLALLMVLSAVLVLVRPYLFSVYCRYHKRREQAQVLVMTEQDEAMLRDQVLVRLDKFGSAIPKVGVSQSSKELASISRQFFKFLLKVDYEFTYEELNREITSRKLDQNLKGIISSFFRRVGEIEYASYEVSKQELQSLADELREIIVLTTNISIPAPAAKSTEESGDIYAMISEGLSALRSKDIDAATAKYNIILQRYKQMPDSDKKNIYIAVRRLLDEINLAKKRK